MSATKTKTSAATDDPEKLTVLLAARDATINKGMEANAVLEKENTELKNKVDTLTDKLERAGGDAFDDSDYDNCSYFIDKLGRKHAATETLRRLAKHRGLRPCSAPVPGGSEDE